MSDMLTHWATSEDILRLASIDPSIEPVFRSIAYTGRDYARLGALTRYGNQFMGPILKRARYRFGTATWTERDERNVAFVLGGLTHQACDSGMKVLLSQAAGVSWNEVHGIMRGPRDIVEKRAGDIARVQELSAYYDAEVFRQVYAAGGARPFSSFFMAELSDDGAAFEEFVRADYQRAMLASHTLIPNLEDVEGWLDELFRVLQPLYLDVPLWVKVYQHPDPQKIEEFMVRTHFYKEDDPTIGLARKVQRGDIIADAETQEVFGQKTTTSTYGDVLQLGLEYLRNASAFWNGSAPELVAPNYTPGAVAILPRGSAA